MLFRQGLQSMCYVNDLPEHRNRLAWLTGVCLLLIVAMSSHHQSGLPRYSQAAVPEQVRFKILAPESDPLKAPYFEIRPKVLQQPVKHLAGALKYQSPFIQRRQAERKLHGLVVAIADRHGLEPALLKAIIRAESGFNANAVSSKGAQGLMQLMPRTAESLGVKDSFNPESNIEGGARYMRYLLDRFKGDLRLALAAYNAGSRHVAHYRGIPPFKATRVYIKKVIGYYHHYKSQSAEA